MTPSPQQSRPAPRKPAASPTARSASETPTLSNTSEWLSLAFGLQPRLQVSQPGDPLEVEADRVADSVMRMPEPQIQRSCGAGRAACSNGDREELQREAEPATVGGGNLAAHDAGGKIAAVRGGRPLTSEQLAFFTPRFGADFSGVRVHTDGRADSAARAVGAIAYTRGSDVVFREGHYRPGSDAGRHLLAHELTHVVQQGAAPGIQRRSSDGLGEPLPRVHGTGAGVASQLLQRFPGDGMLPPGDCDWGRYLMLRGGVETAKAVVSMFGACAAGDNCLTLATKIAAITAEIAARVALDATCFKGGDAGHRQQVQDKVNMLNRCFRFFDTANCPPALVAAMAVVVDQARAVIAATALTVALALVVALVVAIIALVEAILAALAAAAAAAAEAAAIVAAAAALSAFLLLLLEQLSPESPPEA